MNDFPAVIKVLIVDDESDICYLLNGLLQRNNIDSKFVTTLKAAKAELLESTPSLILLDNHLTDGMGLDFMVYVRQHYPSIKIIMITAYDGHEEKGKAFASGAVAFINKPFTRQDILNVLHQVI